MLETIALCTLIGSSLVLWVYVMLLMFKLLRQDPADTSKKYAEINEAYKKIQDIVRSKER